jgi:PTH2 family peptidyl-tRNA hydrolase
MKTKQVIIIRKDLKMRKGKMCSQAAHASTYVMKQIYESKEYFDEHDEVSTWLNDGLSTKITVGCDSEQELKDIYQQAVKAGLLCSIVVDAGLTEFDGQLTTTAVAIGPAASEKIDPITKDLKLL